MDPLRIHDYLVRARHRVLDAVRPLAPEQHARRFPFGLGTIGSTLAHLMTSEWYYIERLQGHEVPPYEQWPIQYENPPAFDVIERMWAEQARNVRAVIAAERDWTRKVTWLGFPDDTRGNKRHRITCTAGDQIAQLALHEAHHRSQVMVMLRELGSPVENIDYNDLMYERVAAE